MLPRPDLTGSPLTASLARSGGIASLLQAVAYVTASLAAMQLPLEKIAHSTAELVAHHSAHPAPMLVLAFSLLALSFLGLGAVVPATGALLDDTKTAWVALGRNVALLSLCVIAAYYTWFLSTFPAFVAAYESGDAITRAALDVMDPKVPMNWVGWFMFGGMGFWVAIVATASRLKERLPRRFVIACVLKTGGFFVALAGIVLHDVQVTIVGTAVGALVGGTLYHTWLGIELLRIGRRIA